jgi:hypothetical protein
MPPPSTMLAQTRPPTGRGFSSPSTLPQFQEVERLPDEGMHVVKKLLDALLTKKQLQALMRG